MRLFLFFKRVFNTLFKLKKASTSKKISQINFDDLYFAKKKQEVFKNNKLNSKKSKLKQLSSFVLFVCILLFLIFSPNYIFKESNYQIDISNLLNSKNNQQTVLTLWHIETFEGGSASRAKYLEKQAIAFNKQQKDCFIVIKTLNENQLFLNLEQKNYPDLFSFGIGAGYMILPFLEKLQENINIRQDLQTYAQKNGQIFAYPYMMGGYLTITREKDYSKNNLDNFTSSTAKNNKKLGFGLSTGEFTNSLKALDLSLFQMILKIFLARFR